MKDKKPLGSYTEKLNSAQLNYTVGEKELMGIIEGSKAFEGMIRGQELTVHCRLNAWFDGGLCSKSGIKQLNMLPRLIMMVLMRCLDWTSSTS